MYSGWEQNADVVIIGSKNSFTKSAIGSVEHSTYYKRFVESGQATFFVANKIEFSYFCGAKIVKDIVFNNLTAMRLYLGSCRLFHQNVNEKFKIRLKL